MAQVGHQLCGRVTEQCLISLQPVKGIMQTYRITNKAPPSRPSFYVRNIFASLQQFLATEVVQQLSSDTRQEWALFVISHVTIKYETVPCFDIHSLNEIGTRNGPQRCWKLLKSKVPSSRSTLNQPRTLRKPLLASLLMRRLLFSSPLMSFHTEKRSNNTTKSSPLISRPSWPSSSATKLTYPLKHPQQTLNKTLQTLLSSLDPFLGGPPLHSLLGWPRTLLLSAMSVSLLSRARACSR